MSLTPLMANTPLALDEGLATGARLPRAKTQTLALATLCALAFWVAMATSDMFTLFFGLVLGAYLVANLALFAVVVGRSRRRLGKDVAVWGVVAALPLILFTAGVAFLGIFTGALGNETLLTWLPWVVSAILALRLEIDGVQFLWSSVATELAVDAR